MNCAFAVSCCHLLVVSRGQDGRRGGLPAGDGGDQRDQGVLAVPVSDLVLHDPDVPGQGRVEVLPAAGRLDQAGPAGAPEGRFHQDGPVGAVGQQFQARQPEFVFHPPQQVSAGTGGRAPVVPAVEQPVREQQPAFLQPRVQRPGQGLLAAALAADGPIAASTGARDPHSQTVTSRTFGNGPSFAPAPNASRFAGCPARPAPSRPPTSAATGPGTLPRRPAPPQAPRPARTARPSAQGRAAAGPG